MKLIIKWFAKNKPELILKSESSRMLFYHTKQYDLYITKDGSWYRLEKIETVSRKMCRLTRHSCRTCYKMIEYLQQIM